MLGQTVINKRLKDLTTNTIGRYLPGSDLSPSLLKTGTADEDFQQEGNRIRPSIYCIA